MSQFIIRLLGLFVAFTLISANPTFAVTSQMFVKSVTTGIALHGFDPVSYFIDHKAVPGHERFELEWSENYWHFKSAANRDRFAEAPEFYIPRYNGYGAQAVSVGRLAEGNPLIWAIFENRLFFFHSVEARNKWVQNPQVNIDSGVLNWKRLKLGLAR